MATRNSNSTSRQAVAALALRIATLACVGAPLAARAESLIGFAQTEETHGLIRISAGVGLVIFSAITIFFHLTGRQAWRKRELELRAEVEALRQQADRARSFSASDSQFVIVWGGASNEPEIEGDIGLALDAPLPRRILGFNTWLSPEQAIAMEANVSRLRERGQGFRIDLVSNNGRHLEAEGRAIGSRAVLRVRDVSGDRLELMRLRALHAEQSSQLENLRFLLDTFLHPVWTRNANGAIAWGNEAYVRAIEAKDRQDVVKRNFELLDSQSCEQAARARESGQVWRVRRNLVVAGERKLMEVFDTVLPAGSGGIAYDLSELEALRADHARQMESHIRTLDQIATAIAIFDHGKTLVFANAAYRQLWGLEPGFLDQKPSDSEILERLRAARRLPEQADFRSWKNGLLSLYRSLDPAPQVWHLPDGRTFRVGFDPNPQGGLTYLFDDVTERFTLESQYNSLARVQSETLDALQEGVAVFGGDGRLKLYNPSFGGMWRLPLSQLSEKPHIDFIAQGCRALVQDDSAWSDLRSIVAGLHTARMGFERRMPRTDGSIVDCAAAPLPDGGTLLTFIDVTDGVNVERALTERNQALEAAERLRDDFVHHVSYELRSPLTNIIGFIQLLGDSSVGPLNEKQREYTSYVLKSSAALLAIINDILDLATIDRDAMELRLEDVDIARSIREASEGVQDRLVESHVELSLVMPKDIGGFRADGKRIRQILFNLLSNAIGFSEPGQTVTLAAFRRSDDLVFKVSDSGRGISPDILDKVFNRFESHTLNSRHRGVGLGLSIVRAFVELHGGRVLIDSAPGEGTVVTCIFPTRGVRDLECPKPDDRAEGQA